MIDQQSVQTDAKEDGKFAPLVIVYQKVCEFSSKHNITLKTLKIVNIFRERFMKKF